LTLVRSNPHPSTWHLTSAPPPPSSPLARFASRSFPPRRAGASPEEEPEPVAAWSPQSQSRGGEEGEDAGFRAVHSMRATIWAGQFVRIWGSRREEGEEEVNSVDCGEEEMGEREFGIEKGRSLFPPSLFFAY